MKNRGFTLIELLAVITILTIILLITFASIGSVVRNSKNNLHKTQINQIEKAAEYYNNKEGLKDYDICINVSDLIDEGYIKQDEVKDPKSEKSIGGSVNIKYNGKKYSYEYQEKVCSNTYVKLLEDTAPSGLSEGDKYTYKVNNTDTFNFYVLKVEGDKVHLIMDRNICEDGTVNYTETNNACNIAWYASSDDNSNGPVTAMQGLYNATKDWTNVPDMNLDYDDEGHIADSSYGYGKIETTATGIKITKKDGTTEVTRSGNLTPVIPYENNKPLKARLPKLEEVYNTDTNDTTHCHDNEGSCPVWLMENIAYYNVSNDKYSINNNNEIYQNINGYWLLSALPSASSGAVVVAATGTVSAGDTSYSNAVGIRPVITVSKSDLS